MVYEAWLSRPLDGDGGLKHKVDGLEDCGRIIGPAGRKAGGFSLGPCYLSVSVSLIP